MFMIIALHCICFYTGKWNADEAVRLYCYDVISDILHGIALPLFTCISGFLYAMLKEKGRYNTYKLFIYNKIKRLVVPLIFWSFFCVLVIPEIHFRLSYLLGYNHLWYLLMLFWLFVIAPLLFRVASKNLIFSVCCSVLFMLMSFLFTKYPLMYLPLELDKAGKYMCVFFVGMIISVYREDLVHINNTILLFIGLICFVAFVVESFFWRDIESYLLLLASQFSRILISTILCFAVIVLFMKFDFKSNVYIGFFSELSMGIYIIHHIIIELLLHIDGIKLFMINNVVMGPIVMMIVVLFISTIISYVLKQNQLLSKLI